MIKSQHPSSRISWSWLSTRQLRPGILILSTALALVYSICVYGLVLQDQPARKVKITVAAASFIIALILLTAILKYLVLPQLHRLSKWSRLIIAALSLLVGFYILTFYPGTLPALHLWPTTLQIIATGEKNAASSGNAVELSGFRSGNEFINYSSFQADGSWKRTGNSLVTNPKKPASLFWKGFIHDSILLFKTSPSSGMVQVTWDQHQKTYDLYSSSPGEITVHDTHLPSDISRRLFWLILGFASSFCFFVLFALILFVGSISLSGFKIIDNNSKLAWKDNPQTATQTQTLRSSYQKYLFLLIALSTVSMMMFLWITRNFGLWIVSDSGNYLSAARHLAAGEGYIALNGDIYDWWPPLYPSLLSIFKWLPFLNEFSWARLLNMWISGATIYISGLLVRQILPTKKWLAILIVILILLARPLVFVATLAMSEPLFNLSIIVFLYFMIRYLDQGQPRDFLLSTGAAASAFLTRYIGSSVVMTGGIVLLILFHGNLLDRLLRTFTFGFSACLPGGLWLARNYILSGSLTGVRTPSELSLGQNLKLTLDTILAWYLPGGWAWIGLAIFLVVAIGMIWIKAHKFSLKIGSENISAVVLMLFVVIYLAQLSVTLTLYNNAAIGDRLLSPIYIPLTIVLAVILDSARQYLQTKWNAHFAAAIGLLLFVIVLVKSGSSDLNISGSQIVTYNGNLSIYSMRNDALVQYLKDNPLPGETVIYSNCPRCLYLFANIHPAIEFNETPKYRHIQPDKKPFYLVWFNTVPPAEDTFGGKYAVPDLQEIFQRDLQIQPLTENPDGAVYLIQPN